MKKQINWKFIFSLILFGIIINIFLNFIFRLFRRKPKHENYEPAVSSPNVTETEKEEVQPEKEESTTVLIKLPNIVLTSNDEHCDTIAEVIDEVKEEIKEHLSGNE